jgi:hypothetical protein
MQPNQLQAQGLDFSRAENYTCEECGNDRFVVNYLIKKFSALLSPTGNEMLTPIQAFACSKCGHINKDFLPTGEGLE